MKYVVPNSWCSVESAYYAKIVDRKLTASILSFLKKHQKLTDIPEHVNRIHKFADYQLIMICTQVNLPSVNFAIIDGSEIQQASDDSFRNNQQFFVKRVELMSKIQLMSSQFSLISKLTPKQISSDWNYYSASLAQQLSEKFINPPPNSPQILHNNTTLVTLNSCIDPDLNLNPAHQHPTMLLISAKQSLPIQNTHLLTDCDVVLEWEPCNMCAMALVHARAKRVFFNKFRKENGGSQIGYLDGINWNYDSFVI
ncbi:Adenoside_deaminase/Cytosine deaminase [Hexamita inflata]|uniref:Adenoside deaminase/Cytosine deaminase n=1 Tax=Hexamita inflata TaxID=28002 RepID=A0AA86U9I7_9EUKA|nr:Adenoside deaminase/Cytosine deaminase [Hexamita inflata]